MVTGVIAGRNAAGLSQIVEEAGLDLDKLLRSLTTAGDERNAVLASLGELPGSDVAPSQLPKRSPSLIRMEGWY